LYYPDFGVFVCPVNNDDDMSLLEAEFLASIGFFAEGSAGEYFW